MNESKINELLEKNFSGKEARPEILEAKVNIDGVDISVHDLMKSCFRRGLEVNFEADVKELYKFSYKPKFESDGLLGSYYRAMPLQRSSFEKSRGYFHYGKRSNWSYKSRYSI